MTASGQAIVSIECSHCGQKGCAVYADGPGATRMLVKLADGFHVETGRTKTGDALIVCDSCDEILPV